MGKKIKNKDKDENLRKQLRNSNLDKMDSIEQSIEDLRSLKKQREKYVEMRDACSMQYEYVDQIYYDGEIDEDDKENIMKKIDVNKERFISFIDICDSMIEVNEEILKSLTSSNSITGKVVKVNKVDIE